MAKRAKCPKCGCDAWSEKNQQCSACGSGWTPYPAQSIREHSDPNWAAAEAKARADAAGDRRQVRRSEKENVERLTQRAWNEGEPEGDAGDKRQEKRSLHLGIPFRPSADELEQADGPLRAKFRAAEGTTITVETTNAGKLKLIPPAPGEKCPTCNRKVPKRRKADAAD